MRCTHCLTDTTPTRWWWLRGYYGISGSFCSACYDLVEHRSDKPLNPEGFEQVRQALANRED
jgi:hypothetical protein